MAGGFDLALMCDVRIASESASFGQPQVLHGIPASYELMAHTIGEAAARDLCLTGRIIDAHEAHRIGVVTRLTPPDELADAALALARTIADQPDTGHIKRRFIAEQPDLFAEPDH